MSECRCGKPTRDEAYVCDACLDRLNRALAEVPWVDAETEVTLTGRRGVDYRTLGGSRATEIPLPVHLGASDARTNLQAILVEWVKFCADENVRNQSPRLGLPSDDLATISRWLMWRVDGLGLSELGPDAVDEITSAVARCHRVIDRPADKWYAGPCEECKAPLYATPNAATVKCRNVTGTDSEDEPIVCGNVVDVATRRAALLVQAEDRLASAANVARSVSWLGAAPLTPARVRQWAARGRILPHGHDGKTPLYRIGDAIDLLAGETNKVG